MKREKRYILFLIFLILLCLSAYSQTSAFPGAEGGGMYTTGGRGGAVYYVNTLEDNETGNSSTREGSFRWCLNQDEKRTILFKVNGTIRLIKPLNITKGNLTVAGQSALGDGICLAYYPVSIDADNVIIRFLRFRMGDEKVTKEHADGADALGGRKRQNIIIDHCSVSWGTDECSSFYDNKDFTMQWCIVSESLRLAGHSKGAHGYGTIWGGVNASFHHNLLAHHDSRCPRLGPGHKYAGTDTVDVRNNVYYNWNGNGCYGGEAMHINIVNNYYKAGPATNPKVARQIFAIDANKGTSGFERIKDVWGKCYIEGNYISVDKNITNNNWLGIMVRNGKAKEEIKSENPFKTTPITTHDAFTAYKKVLEHAGCSKVRDALDNRIIGEVRDGKANFIGKSKYNALGDQWKSIGYPKLGIIDSQSDLKPSNADESWSAWPDLKTSSELLDNNSDGIPNGWLEKHYPTKKATDVNEEGYTYLEVYLNSLVQDIINSPPSKTD